MSEEINKRKINIAAYIKELICLNECIILTGFGGFETSYQPAHVDPGNYTLAPPGKLVTFRPDYVVGNGLLEDHMVKKLGIPRTRAEKLIDDYAVELTVTLENENRVTIPGVGTISKLQDGKLKYDPVVEENFLAESFGLTEVSIKPITTISARPISSIKLPETSNDKPKRRTGLAILLGIISVLLVAGFAVFLINRYDVNLFSLGQKKDLSTEDNMIVFGSRDPDTTLQIIAKRLDEYTAAREALRPDFDHQPIEKFFIVAGSFSKKQNAGKLYLELGEKGYNPRMIYSDGLFRVIIGDFTSKEDAIRELYRIRNTLDRSIWLMSK